jgi:hypothetical protein
MVIASDGLVARSAGDQHERNLRLTELHVFVGMLETKQIDSLIEHAVRMLREAREARG